MTASSPVTPAPGELEFVRAFVNTLDIEKGTDRLGDPATSRAWARDHGADAPFSHADVEFARQLREALRAGMLANHDRAPMPAETSQALQDAAARAGVTPRFSSTGVTLASTARGPDAVLGRIVAAVAEALADGTWSRLKACAADDCRWGFYDSSRSRTGQWCSMSICGNRAKQARWREAAASRE
jgi:predicted RNA-binding Zn ribbon-like protein